jgi:hypothetical protein
MAFLPVAWKAATLSDPGRALRTKADCNDCRASGVDVRKAVAARVEALREETCLVGTAVRACRSIEDLAIVAISAGS